MQVILVKEVDNLGKEGDVVTVRPGFARNYLMPHKLAVEVTKGNLSQVEHLRKKRLAREQKELAMLQSVIHQVEGTVFEIIKKAGGKGKLYGSVTTREIAELVSQKLGTNFDRKYIVLPEPIKETGSWEVKLKLGKSQEPLITIVVKTAEEKAEEGKKTASGKEFASIATTTQLTPETVLPGDSATERNDES
ncbi:MAG TPA: 50S ribosomal protein L9 [Atribacteraceae bacterium]|nr:50S ribosomal protein L9 [Atribacteraceae bacterium]